MFENYNNNIQPIEQDICIFESYDNNTQPIYGNYECQINNQIMKKPLGIYDVNNNLVGYKWIYGDLITLEFNITGYVTDGLSSQYKNVAQYLNGKYFQFLMFDYRHNVVIDRIYSSTVDSKNYKVLIFKPINWDVNKTIYYKIVNNECVHCELTDAWDTLSVDYHGPYYRDISGENATTLKVFIDKIQSDKLVRGAYTCSLTLLEPNPVTNEEPYIISQTLFSESSAKLFVE